MDAVQKPRTRGHPGHADGHGARGVHAVTRRSCATTRRTRTGPTATASSSAPATARCCSTASLHLSGYDLPLDELKQFRQWGSLTPGHPERDRVHVTPGVEVTTGPLGQGFANGVGMAMAERFLRERYGAEVHGPPHLRHRLRRRPDGGHRVRGGVARRPARARPARLPLRRQLDLARRPDVAELRHRGRHASASRPTAGTCSRSTTPTTSTRSRPRSRRASDEERAPTLIRVKSIIGYPSPNKQGTSKAHGVAAGRGRGPRDQGGDGLGSRRARSSCPTASTRRSAPRARRRGAGRVERALRRVARRRRGRAPPSGTPPGTPASRCPASREALPPSTGTRTRSRRARRARRRWPRSAPFVPTMVGGAADLAESTKTEFPGDEERFTPRPRRPQRLLRRARARHGRRGQRPGRPRRHRAPLRLDVPAVRRLHARLDPPLGADGPAVAWVFTHDSVALGEDGPTHQPVEHLAALRAIPGLVVLRPADANETAEAWRVILEDLEGPAALVLSRQDLPILDRDELAAAGVGRGAYVLARRRRRRGGRSSAPARRSGVALAARRAARATASARASSRCRAGSCSQQQDEDYRDDVLPAGRCRRCRSRPAISMGWERWVDARVVDRPLRRLARPGAEVLEKLGITPAHVAQVVASDLLERPRAYLAAAAPARAAATVTWIAAGSRTQAMRSSAVRRSSRNWNARACAARA